MYRTGTSPDTKTIPPKRIPEKAVNSCPTVPSTPRKTADPVKITRDMMRPFLGDLFVPS